MSQLRAEQLTRAERERLFDHDLASYESSRDRLAPVRRRGRALSLRNRELLHLLGVGILTAAGFTAVFLARQASDDFSTASLSYAAFFGALFLAAHLVLRVRLPHADPYLLPLVGILTAVGLTLIYRIDPDLAFKQGLWVVVGVVAFAVVVVFVPDYRRLDSLKYTLGIVAVGLLVLPALPGIGATINGASLWVAVGPITFQPGEFAKVALVIFLAGYLRDNREMLSMGVGRAGLPSPKHFGPLLVIWGAAMLVLFQTNDLGGGASLLLRLPRHALRRDGPLDLRCVRVSGSSSRARTGSTT